MIHSLFPSHRYLPTTTTDWRDRFFEDMLSWVCLLGKDPNSAVVGANLWAYGGDAFEGVNKMWTPGLPHKGPVFLKAKSLQKP